MTYILRLVFFLIPILTLAAQALASDDPSLSQRLTLSQLSATVSHSDMVYAPQMLTLPANRVENVGNGGFGVVGIVQGGGAQSNTQQNITVTIGRLNLSPVH